jgi:uncharacterized protein
MMKHLEHIFSKASPKSIILLGDVKHEFGIISGQEWKDTLKLLDYLSAKGEVILIRGNHDKVLGPIAKRKDILIRDYFCVGQYFFCHGDKIFDNKELKKSKTIIIGHEHPAVGIRDGPRLERYKCFLSGKYQSKNLIVLPSFSFVTEGADVLQEKTLSPFIKNIGNFEVFVASDKGYAFGKIKTLMKLNPEL